MLHILGEGEPAGNELVNGVEAEQSCLPAI